jgi:hypothetical protein
MGAWTDDPLWAFLAGYGRDLAKRILYFKFREKFLAGGLREASKEKLLEAVLKMKMLRMKENRRNISQWSVVVDEEGIVIEGCIREVVRRGLVTTETCRDWWGLGKRENGDIYDRFGIYGERGVVYGSRFGSRFWNSSIGSFVGLGDSLYYSLIDIAYSYGVDED